MLLDVSIEVVFSGILAFLLLLVAFKRKRRSNYPPGPIGLPIVGYLPFLTHCVYLKFMKLSEKYGKVFSLRLGSLDVVVLNSSDVVREAFAKPEFLGRPPNNAFSYLEMKSPFFESDMRIWEEQSKYVVKTMKNLGLGKSQIEYHIMKEIECLLSALQSTSGEPTETKKLFIPSASNNICSLVFGKRLDYDHPDRLLMDKAIYCTDESVSQIAAQIFFPWLNYAPSFLQKVFHSEVMIDLYQSFKKIIKRIIEEHKASLTPEAANDFIDFYLLEMEQRKIKEPDTTFTEETLYGQVSDLFGAGSITVAASLVWAIYVMASFPDHQKRVQKEIQKVVGTDGLPTIADQKLMPYTQAVLLEVMRWKTTVPLNILRFTLKDTTVGGYDIPSGTTVMVNFWGIHHDPTVWEDPDSFLPHRFLSEDGLSVIKPPSYMPFSIGKRACPGEAMANLEIFLYFVSIFKKFDVTLPDGMKPTYDSSLSVILSLNDSRVCFTERKLERN